jgi:F0F1-type ATP synthase assembly protein I
MNPRQKSIVVGAILGGSIGALAGYLFARGAENVRGEQALTTLSLKSVPGGEVVKLLISVMAVLRSIAELGERT